MERQVGLLSPGHGPVLLPVLCGKANAKVTNKGVISQALSREYGKIHKTELEMTYGILFSSYQNYIPFSLLPG